MEKKGLQLVISQTQSDDEISVAFNFVRDGQDVHFGDVTINEKYYFVKALMQMAGVMSKMTLNEMGHDPEEEQKDE